MWVNCDPNKRLTMDRRPRRSDPGSTMARSLMRCVVRSLVLSVTRKAGGPIFNINLHTWGESLLPYLEANTVYERIDFNSPNYAPIIGPSFPHGGYTGLNPGGPCCPCASSRPTAAVIAAFVCPSTTRDSNPFVDYEYNNQFCGYGPPFLPAPTGFGLTPPLRVRGASDYILLSQLTCPLTLEYAGSTPRLGTRPKTLPSALTRRTGETRI
jgi:hypothetical protein